MKKGLGSLRSWVDESFTVKDDGERKSWVLIVYLNFFEKKSCQRREKRKFVGGEGTFPLCSSMELIYREKPRALSE